MHGSGTCQIVVSLVCLLRRWTVVGSNGGAGVVVAAAGGGVRCRVKLKKIAQRFV